MTTAPNNTDLDRILVIDDEAVIRQVPLFRPLF